MILSIIIVNYNVKFLLEQCLHSVSRAIAGIPAETFIVDNASADGSIAYLEPRFPAFHFIRNEVNTGFAKANNIALAKARGKYVLFLNPDTVLPEDCFSKCIDFMEAHVHAGAIGVKMINGHGQFLKESKRGFPSPLTSFWKMTGFTELFPHSRWFARYYLGHLNENQSHEVDALSGAFMFVRKETLDKTGGFDEQFFMYAEDIDLSYRITKNGYKNYYYPGTIIIHYKGESTLKNLAYVNQFYKAMNQFVRKHFSKRYSGLFIGLLNMAIGLKKTMEAIKRTRKKEHKNNADNKKLFIYGDEESMQEMKSLLNGDPSGIITSLKSEAAKTIVCEGENFSSQEVISYIRKHPGPAYTVHMKGSGS